MKSEKDAYGKVLLAQLTSGTATCEIIERDDNYIDTGSEPGLYFSEFKNWSKTEKLSLKHASGRILDIGCGAGRHSLYLQGKGFDVTAMDNSPGAIRVCKLRGVRKAQVRAIDQISNFRPASFDTALMMGNNFGLFGDPDKATDLLSQLHRITSQQARIIAGTRNPYNTDHPDHLRYHKLNKKRGKMAGQITMRIRFGTVIGDWFEYFFVSPEEMGSIVEGTGWKIERFFGETDYDYFALITKQSPALL